ncbi:MAG: hypothetical protein ACHQU8_04415 [Gemmatimonadales bacterium]
MEFVGQLWLPIVVAAVIVFITSAVIWMAMPWHKTEFEPLPDEDGLMAVLRKGNVGAGMYLFPFMSGEMRKDKAKMEAHMKKWAEGPAGTVNVVPRGPMSMGKMMAQSIVFYLIVNIFLAYIGAHTVVGHATYLQVFRVIGTVAFMTYFFGTVPWCIWFGHPWKTQWLQIIDALLMACMTAGTFGWLWPR